MRAQTSEYVALSKYSSMRKIFPSLTLITRQQSTQGIERIGWLLDNYLRESFVTLCDIIRRGQEAGKVRQGDPARLYYAVIGLCGTLLSVSTEFQILTGRDVFAPDELPQTTQAIFLIICSSHHSGR